MYKLDKLYCAIVKHIAAEKGCSNRTQVGVVNPEQKHLKLDVSQWRLQSEPDTNALQGPPDKSKST